MKIYKGVLISDYNGNLERLSELVDLLEKCQSDPLVDIQSIKTHKGLLEIIWKKLPNSIFIKYIASLWEDKFFEISSYIAHRIITPINKSAEKQRIF